MAVKNLLKRCVDGRAFPKHTETERGPEAFGDEAAVHHDEPKLTTKTVQWFGKGAGLGTQDSDKPKTKARVTPQDEEAKKLEERTRQVRCGRGGCCASMAHPRLLGVCPPSLLLLLLPWLLQAMANLLIIADYITDFEDIIAQVWRRLRRYPFPQRLHAAMLV